MFFPFARLDAEALKLITAELGKLGALRIETKGFEDVSDINNILAAKPKRLETLSILAPNAQPASGIRLSLGSKDVAQIFMAGAPTAERAQVYLAVSDILRKYSSPNRERWIRVGIGAQIVYTSLWISNMLHMTGVPRPVYPAWANILYYTLLVLSALVFSVGMTLGYLRRTRITLESDYKGWLRKNRDALIIGVLTCFVAGLLVLVLTPLVVK